MRLPIRVSQSYLLWQTRIARQAFEPGAREPNLVELVIEMPSLGPLWGQALREVIMSDWQKEERSVFIQQSSRTEW